MRRTGILGGTFNPIHNGHLMLAHEAQRQFSLDEVLFMPCGIAYMKADTDMESAQIRAEMTALAIQDNPFFCLSTIEIERQGNTYTYQTMESLKVESPDTEYFFIMGADSLFHIEQWRYPERIFANCCILAAIRDDKTTADMESQIRRLKSKYSADIRLLKTECMNISSSDIRRKIAAGESIADDVPESVREYIEKRGLYG